MSSDREPEVLHYGPAPEDACQRFADDANRDKGIGDYAGGARYLYVAPYHDKGDNYY